MAANPSAHPGHGWHQEAVRHRTQAGDARTVNLVLRAVALVAAAVPTVVALVALLRLDWSVGGLDAAPVEVAGLSFTPWVAIGTAIAGVIALAVAASPDRESKLVYGAILVCVGVATLLAGSTAADLDLEDGHGWMALIVGAVLVVVGLALRAGWWTRRDVVVEDDDRR